MEAEEKKETELEKVVREKYNSHLGVMLQAAAGLGNEDEIRAAWLEETLRRSREEK